MLSNFATVKWLCKMDKMMFSTMLKEYIASKARNLVNINEFGRALKPTCALD